MMPMKDLAKRSFQERVAVSDCAASRYRKFSGQKLERSFFATALPSA